MDNTIYFFPKYSSKGPSSRYRIFNYIEFYEREGYKTKVTPLFGDWYLESLWAQKQTIFFYFKIIKAYLKRLKIIFSLPSASLIYIGAELLPYVPFGIEYFLRIKKIKYIVEFDDAIFHNYDQSNSTLIKNLLSSKTNKVLTHASYIITGCQYLTDFCKKKNSNIIEIPTCIDKRKYSSPKLKANNNEFVIGWIGSPTQSKQILKIIPSLKKLNQVHDFKLNLIGFDRSLEIRLEGLPYHIIDWNDATEIDEMRKFSVGIMPLEETPFNNGKCAFKLVQYMAIGIPTISTPLQSNININKNSGNLFATNIKEWYECFQKVILNRKSFEEVGKKNKEIALNKYSIQANYPTYTNIFNVLLKTRSIYVSSLKK